MGQLLVPALIGGGVGAVGGAVSGRNPFKSALLGAGLGAGGAGLMGAASGTGSSLLSGFKGVEAAVPSLGSGGYAALGQNVIVPVIAPVASSTASALPFGSTEFISPYTKEGIVNFTDGTTSTLAPDYLSAGVNYGVNAPNFTPVLGKSADYIGGGYNPSFFGRVGDMIGNPFTDLTARDKLGLGLQGASMLNQPQQMIQPARVTPITRGKPEAVSAPLFNVAPNVGMQQGNEIGLPNLKSTIPLTDEEILRLQQMLQTTGFRGR